MSIRIHQLSKKIGMDNKDLVTLLQQRGYHVTSASSTIDNISADSLVKEFGNRGETGGTAGEASGGASTAVAAPEVAAPAKPDPEAATVTPAVSKAPEGVFVKI